MFKKLVYISALALASSSCIMDRYDDLDAAAPVEILSRGTYYLAFNIDPLGNDVGTRADGALFEDGTDESKEHLIGSAHNYLLFFDSKKNLSEVLDLVSTDDHDDPFCEKFEEVGIEARYAAKIEVEEGYEAPSYCLVILNAGTYENELKELKKIYVNGNPQKPPLPMDDFLGREWKDAADPKRLGRDGEYFTMTNSVYVGSDGALKIDGSTVPPGVIQKETDVPDKNKVIHVHVERMVSKFSFDYYDPKLAGLKGGQIFMPDGAQKNIILFSGKFDQNGLPVYEFDKYQWQAVVTGWGMNAYETSTNLFKKVTPGTDNYYSNWRQTGWNDPEHFRSYWAEDPHYTQTDYPIQFRRAVDRNQSYYEEKYKKSGGVVSNTNTLINFSYDQILEADNWEKGFVYTPENTYDYKTIYSGLDGRADALAGTHLILCAELQTNIDGSMKSASIYRDRDRFFYRTPREVFIAHVAKLGYLLGSQQALKYHHYYWDQEKYHGASDPDNILVADTKGSYGVFYKNGNSYTELTPAVLETFELPGGNYLIDAEVKDGDGRMFINFDNLVILDRTTMKEFKIYTNQEWETAVEKNRNRKKGEPETIPATWRSQPDNNDIRSMVFEWLGPVGFFNQGRMYYYKAPKITDVVHGTVRNAWYKYYLKSIASIGSPVSSPENPIVPLDVENHDQMFDIEIELLPWHKGLDADVPILNAF